MRRTNHEKTILVLSVIGIVLASYAVTLHYSPAASSFCTLSANINCDKVNKSPWATILTIPVAILGLLAYLAVFLITLKRETLKRSLGFTHADYTQYFLWLVVAMFCFQLYLTYVEAFIIHAYCIICIASQLCTLALAYTGWREHFF